MLQFLNERQSAAVAVSLLCQLHVSQVSLVETVQHVRLMVCWEGAGPLLKAEKSCSEGVENMVQRGYFHDPISIKEAKLFMWSAYSMGKSIVNAHSFKMDLSLPLP